MYIDDAHYDDLTRCPGNDELVQMDELELNALWNDPTLPCSLGRTTQISQTVWIVRPKSKVVYCILTEANLGIMSCRHDTYPS